MKKKTQKKTNPDGRLASLCYGGLGVGAQRCGRGAAPGAAQLCGASGTGTAGRGREGEKGKKGRERRGDGRKEGEAESRGAAGTCARSVTHALQRGRIQAAAPRGRAGSSEDTDGSRLRTARCRPAPPRPPPHEAPGLRVLA